jgi:RND superfamily putative drug exporter
MFGRLGHLVLRARVPIVVAWLLLVAGAFVLVPSLASLTASQEAGFLPRNSPARLAAERLAAAFPERQAAATATVVFSREGLPLSDADRAAVAEVAAWLRGTDVPAGLADVLVSVEGAADVPGYEAMYRSTDGALEMLSVRLSTDPMGQPAREAVEVLREHLASVDAEGLDADVTGTVAITADYLAAVIAGTDRTTLVTIVLVVTILLLIYRAPVAATIPLITIGAAFVVARAVLALLAMAGWQIPSLLDSFIVVLVFGIGTDYAIFLLSRYREELGRGARDRAAVVTVGRIGAVITASAATVIVGLSAMAVASFGMIQTIGPALAITVAITLAAGLTLTPALAVLAGRWLYWPRHEAVVGGTAHAPGAWDRLAAFITAHPGRVAGTVVVLLALPLLALPTLTVEFDTIKELPARTEARRGFDRVAAHFDRGQLLPVSVLLEAPDGADLGAPAGLAAVAEVSRALGGIDGVRSVRSLVTPAGDGTVPDGLRPSSQLQAMVEGLSAGTDPLKALAALADPATLAALDGAVGYLDGLAAAFPDLAERALGSARQDAAGLRAALAAYQAAADGSPERSDALAAAVGLAGALPGRLREAADAFAGRPDDLYLPASAATDPAMGLLLETYLSSDRRSSQLSLVTADEPYSAAAFATVGRVRAVLADWTHGGGAETDDGGDVIRAPGSPLIEAAYVGGPTATSADVQSATTEDFKLVGLITVLGVFIVLVLLLRSLVAPLYLVGSVLLSFATTLGVATLIFQGLLGQDGLNYLVPLIVFVLLVALGSDYNIFLMSRVREESALRDLRSGITIASARTGTVITSAGIILAGTFAALTVAPLQVLQQVGLTVALGVLIDTLIVRSLLIPALTALVGERAWWPSRPRATRQHPVGGEAAG